MLFLADENLEAQIQVQLRLHYPGIDIIDVRDVGLDHTPDEDILQWAAENNRIVVMHDKSTMRPIGWRQPGLALPLCCGMRNTFGLADESIQVEQCQTAGPFPNSSSLYKNSVGIVNILLKSIKYAG